MYELTTLPNQLRVVTVPLASAHSVSAGVYFAVGSRYETEPENGAAHFIEHMLFKGTKTRKALEIATIIESVGGYSNAGTGRETTTYYTLMIPQHLGLALDLLSDMVLNSAFPSRELERERGVIVEEINRTLDTPDDLVFEMIANLEYPDSPLGRSIAGTHETVTAMTRARLVKFMKRYYVTNGAAVVVAGPVSHQQVVSEVQRYFSTWEPGAISEPDPARRRCGESGVGVEVRGTEQAQMCLSLRGVARRDPDRFAVDVMTAVLGDGMGSRLFQEIREKRGLAYAVDASSSHMMDTGAFVVYAGVPPEKATEALAATVEQLDRIRKKPVSPEELGRAKEYSKGRLLLGMETPSANASWIGSQVVQGLEVMLPEDYVAALDAVTADDVLRVARKLFDGCAPQLALVGPFEDVEPFKALLKL